jgi:peptide-methionine (S)-S-oxide reductase
MLKSLLIGTAAIGTTLAFTYAPGAGVQAAPVSAPLAAGDQVAVFAGGCFWGMEGLFEHVKGVKAVSPGYAGGTARDANYPAVSSETTRHAESIRVVYDPKQVSYTDLLGVFFTVAHDPTQVNGQYPDEGPSYRSAIFPQNASQRQIAAAYIASLNRSGAFAKPIATKLETGQFYPAEPEHQDFMRRNPNHPYIAMWDKPRLTKLAKTWPQFYRN